MLTSTFVSSCTKAEYWKCSNSASSNQRRLPDLAPRGESRVSQNEEKSREELRAQLEKTLRLADAATDKLTRHRLLEMARDLNQKLKQ